MLSTGASSRIPRPRATDATITIDDEVIALGAPDSGFVIERVSGVEVADAGH